ncbi:MAG: LacI family transcriptional regulator, partial [Anaerolineae bacterium]|nr:LacI family transcriptional regulator [Anaerolineae bacterium]
MKKISLFVLFLMLVSVILAGCGAPATPAPVKTEAPAATEAPAKPAETEAPPAAGETPLYVAINKSADQQYFIDLQNAFVAKSIELGGDAKKFDAKLDPN